MEAKESEENHGTRTRDEGGGRGEMGEGHHNQGPGLGVWVLGRGGRDEAGRVIARRGLRRGCRRLSGCDAGLSPRLGRGTSNARYRGVGLGSGGRGGAGHTKDQVRSRRERRGGRSRMRGVARKGGRGSGAGGGGRGRGIRGEERRGGGGGGERAWSRSWRPPLPLPPSSPGAALPGPAARTWVLRRTRTALRSLPSDPPCSRSACRRPRRRAAARERVCVRVRRRRDGVARMGATDG